MGEINPIFCLSLCELITTSQSAHRARQPKRIVSFAGDRAYSPSQFAWARMPRTLATEMTGIVRSRPTGRATVPAPHSAWSNQPRTVSLKPRPDSAPRHQSILLSTPTSRLSSSDRATRGDFRLRRAGVQRRLRSRRRLRSLSIELLLGSKGAMSEFEISRAGYRISK